MKIKCIKCAAVYKSPIDDSFRNLFSSFGEQGVKQAEKTGNAYMARKSGWVQDETGVIWACPECNKGLT